jgi:hypothetical protein
MSNGIIETTAVVGMQQSKGKVALPTTLAQCAYLLYKNLNHHIV